MISITVYTVVYDGDKPNNKDKDKEPFYNDFNPSTEEDDNDCDPFYKDFNPSTEEDDEDRDPFYKDFEKEVDLEFYVM